MPPSKINPAAKLAQFTDQWAPRIVGTLNDHDIRVAKIEGEFIWHQHDNTDELFFVVAGTLLMKFRDGDVTVNAGEMIVVPAGTAHLPVANAECHILMIEREGTPNTGNITDSDRTVDTLERL